MMQKWKVELDELTFYYKRNDWSERYIKNIPNKIEKEKDAKRNDFFYRQNVRILELIPESCLLIN